METIHQAGRLSMHIGIFTVEIELAFGESESHVKDMAWNRTISRTLRISVMCLDTGLLCD